MTSQRNQKRNRQQQKNHRQLENQLKKHKCLKNELKKHKCLKKLKNELKKHKCQKSEARQVWAHKGRSYYVNFPKFRKKSWVPIVRSYMQFFSRFGGIRCQKVNFSTFSGKLTFQCSRNGPQHPPFCPGSLQDTFIIYSSISHQHNFRKNN